MVGLLLEADQPGLFQEDVAIYSFKKVNRFWFKKLLRYGKQLFNHSLGDMDGERMHLEAKEQVISLE